MKLMHLIVGALFLLGGLVTAQNYNKIDANGKKQGPWQKYYEKSKQLRYEGQFKDDEPVGTFKYYTPEGKIRSIVKHRGKQVSYAQDFDSQGLLLIEGKYVSQKKDSVWTYYQYEGTKRKVLDHETYNKGIKTGVWKTYHSNGTVIREFPYKNDKMNGLAKYYYETGVLKSEVTFVDDRVNGRYTYYYSNKLPMKVGTYKNGVPDGKWITYNKDGKVRKEEVFTDGVSNNPDELEKEAPVPLNIDDIDQTNKKNSGLGE